MAPPPLGGVHTIGQPSSAMSTNDSSSSDYQRGGASAEITGFTASQLPTSSGGSSGRSNKGQSLRYYVSTYVYTVNSTCM